MSVVSAPVSVVIRTCDSLAPELVVVRPIVAGSVTGCGNLTSSHWFTEKMDDFQADAGSPSTACHGPVEVLAWLDPTTSLTPSYFAVTCGAANGSQSCTRRFCENGSVAVNGCE